jgi:hypothetical protein
MFSPAQSLTPISLDDLAKYSQWPKRLLSLEAFAVKYKTEKEVLREFQDEKWGQLLKQVRSLSNPTLLEIEQAHVDLKTVFPCYDAGAFYLANERQMLDKHLDLYAEVLRPHLKDASCLVELGAGYGSKLLSLAQREGFSKLPLVAGEYTQSGRDLISILADALGKRVAVGHCDFRKLKIEGVTIPENAVIFTSYAVHYVPELSMDFVGFLSLLKPRAVVHFEPCYEHYSMDSLHGMMCRRYVELNDYARNFVTIIEASCNSEGIQVRMRKNVLGSNPFLPISVIEWAPEDVYGF